MCAWCALLQHVPFHVGRTIPISCQANAFSPSNGLHSDYLPPDQFYKRICMSRRSCDSRPRQRKSRTDPQQCLPSAPRRKQYITTHVGMGHTVTAAPPALTAADLVNLNKYSRERQSVRSAPSTSISCAEFPLQFSALFRGEERSAERVWWMMENTNRKS